MKKNGRNDGSKVVHVGLGSRMEKSSERWFELPNLLHSYTHNQVVSNDLVN
jgi:hypothetical protein